MLLIRALLARENKRRDAEPPDETYDDVYVVVVGEDGEKVERKVSKVRWGLSYCVAWLMDVRVGIFGFDG